MELVIVATVSVVLHTAASAHTTVYVKFLAPPHGYSHNLHLNTREGVAVAKEERLYPGDFRNSGFQHNRIQEKPPFVNQFQQNRALGNQFQHQQPTNYYYPRPNKPFEKYGPPQVKVHTEEPYLPNGEYNNPDTFGLSQHQAEVTYDPKLITGPQAAQYVHYLFSRGELFFHLIPHERLVLMNQQERIENNLVPHILASIRPGHPFFFHR